MTVTDIDPDRPAHARGTADDTALIARMAAGEDAALGALYDRWASRLYAVSVQIVKQQDDAEDVLEETFWQVWRLAGSYSPAQGTVATWLLNIVRTRSLEKLHARPRPKDAPLETRYDITETGQSGQPRHVQAPDRARALGAALHELSDEQRQVFELAYFHGLNQAEIAERLGDPLGTIRMRLQLAVQQLRERLQSAEAFSEGAPG
jgi:RNA polymerase sigma-70 factor (ECF subfamily)